MNPENREPGYRSISCSSYEEYELAILQRRRLRLAWNEENVAYEQIVTPLDLRTADGQEFLVLRLANGDVRELRLDRIRRAETL